MDTGRQGCFLTGRCYHNHEAECSNFWILEVRRICLWAELLMRRMQSFG